MATVVIDERKRNDGKSYCIYFKDPFTGKRKYYKTTRKKREADKLANDLRYLIDNGRLPEASKSNRKARLLTFTEVAEEQIIDWKRRLQNKDIQPETANEYIRRTRRIAKAVGKKFLCELTTDDIKDFRDKIAQSTSNISANRSLFMIKQVFKKGLELNSIPEDPTEAIRYLSEKDHQRNNFQLPHQINALIDASQQTKAKYYMPVIIYLAIEHGFSKQEILSLRWDEDINLDYDGKGIIRRYRTKNGFEGTEYLMPRTRKALIRWREHLEFVRYRKKVTPVDNFVICHQDGTRKKGFASAWRKIRKIAGFEDLHFHDNRHTFCSNVLLSGGNLKETSEMIGHSDISMTDRYTHLTGLRKLYRQEKLAEHYANENVAFGGSGEHIGNTKPIFVPENKKTAK